MLRVSLLGAQIISDDATGAVLSRSSRCVALLAFLCCWGGVPQTRHRVAAAFWPESTNEQALTNLRRELHHLRQVLDGSDSLAVTSSDLCWYDSDTCEVDVRVFYREYAAAVAAADTDPSEVLLHGRSALARYGGELLPGAYDDWVLDRREQLEQDCADLCAAMTRAARATGDIATAVDTARRRVQVRPLEEENYRILMEIQSEIGDRAGAVSTYHHCASVLERELGITPAPETTALVRRLVGASNAEPQPSAPTGTHRGRGSWVGRRTEMAAIGDAWQRASGGEPTVVLVTGAAGVGKTRLMTEFGAYAARSGAMVASSRCFDTAGRLSLAPVADWLSDPAFQAYVEHLDPVWQTEVTRLVPSAIEQRPAEQPTRIMIDAWQRYRFFEGLVRGLLSPQRPTMLMLDNLQWCDEETLAFLSFLLDHAGNASLLLAATLRDAHDNESVRDWHGRMRTAATLQEWSLEPLDIDEVGELAARTFERRLDADEVGLLHATTGGFPLYVEEAARSALDLAEFEASSDGLSDMLRDRLERTSPQAQAVAGLAAAFGRTVTLPVLTEASELGDDGVVRAVDELWRQRILREIGDGYDFSHDLLRDAAYRSVSTPQRWLLHRRLARALELGHRGHTDEIAAQLAEQYARAGDTERAIAYSRRAAEQSAAMFAHKDAIGHQRRTLALLDGLPRGRQRDEQEVRCLESLAAMVNAAEGYSSAYLQQLLEHTIELTERHGAVDSLKTAMVGLWASRFVQGRTRESYQIALQLLDLVTPEDPRLGQVHMVAAGSSLHLGDPRAALPHFDVAAGAAEDESLTFGTRARVHAGAWSAHAAWLLGDADAADKRCDRAVEQARSAEHPYTLAVALAYAGITHQLLDQREFLGNDVAELRALCRRYDFAYYRDWGLALEGWLSGGKAGAARVQRAIDNLAEIHAFARMPYWLSLLAEVVPRTRQAAVLDSALNAAESYADRWFVPELLRRRAGLDRPDRRGDRLRAAADLARKQDSVVLVQRCVRDLAGLSATVRSARRRHER